MARAREEESEMNNAMGQMTPPPRAASTVHFNLFDDGDVLAARPTPLVEVRPQPGVLRHSGALFVDFSPFVQILDDPVPQMGGEQVVEFTRKFDAPVLDEQVIAVPKISLDRVCPRRLPQRVVEIISLLKFCVLGLVHATRAFSAPFSSSFFCSRSELALQLAQNSTVPPASPFVPSLSKLRMSPAVAAQAVSTAASTASDAGYTDDFAPGQSNMWCPLLEEVYHCSIGGDTAMIMCCGGKAALSQSCHFCVFVNPVARVSTDHFFTFCDEHLAQERDSQAECLRRRHEQCWPMQQEHCGAH